MVQLGLGWIRCHTIADADHVGQYLRRSGRVLLSNRQQIIRQIRHRIANAREVIRQQHDSHLLRRIHHRVVFRVLQCALIARRRQTPARRHLKRQRIRHRHLIARKQPKAHRRRFVIRLQARIRTGRGRAESKGHHGAIHIVHAGGIRSKADHSHARTGYRMIADSNAHVRGEGIRQECVDPRAHRVELRTAHRDGVTH